MSQKIANADLKGYFPIITLETVSCQRLLNRVFDLIGPSLKSLREVGESIGLHCDCTQSNNERPITADRYEWFCGLYFSDPDVLPNNGKIAILFPWCQDWSNKERVQLDRSIAVYGTNGLVLKADWIGCLLNTLSMRLMEQEAKRIKPHSLIEDTEDETVPVHPA